MMALLDHLLISPLRLLPTPSGVGVARGLHGGGRRDSRWHHDWHFFGLWPGVAATMQQGDLLLRLSGKRRGQARQLAGAEPGFWNCYGSYYAELFRPASATTLRALSAYFREAGVPVRYIGLDLWYHYDQVGFARRYQPDAEKYPQGLKVSLQRLVSCSCCICQPLTWLTGISTRINSWSRRRLTRQTRRSTGPGSRV